MRLRRRPERLLDADVQLGGAEREPAPAPHREQRRLLELRQAQEAAVERPGRLLATGRGGDLDVVQAGDRRHRDARPSYSGFGCAATATNVIPPSPATTMRVAAASTRR